MSRSERVEAERRRGQSALRPAKRTTFAHLSMSSVISFARSAGDNRAVEIVKPLLDTRICHGGVDLPIELLMMSFGVLLNL
jgi:hypothetical protein